MYLPLAILTVSMLASSSETSLNEATHSQQFENKFNLLMVKIEHLERSETELREKIENLERSETELKEKTENLERSETELKKRVENLEVESEKKMDNFDTDILATFTDNREERDKSAEEIDAVIAPRAGNNTEQRLAYLEELSKMNLRRSCHELSQYGVNVNNHYYVDPDGELVGAAPIRVWCDFSKGSAVTEVMHNSEEKIAIHHCHDPGCDVRKIEYSAPDFQIQSLIQVSENCSQSIEYNCLMAPLQKDDVDFAFWLDNSGQRQTYWDGANAGQHVCGCYFTEEGCLDESTTHHTCNCDNNVPEMESDFGTITNTSALPVTQLQFGGLTYEMQQASYQLGRLRCWGQASFEPGTSCTAIKRAGEFRSGFFNIRKSQDVNSELVLCKSSPGYDDNEDNEVFVESSEDHFLSVESTISGIETDITDVGGQVSTLESTVSGIETEITEMKTDITDVGGQVSILESTVSGIETEITEMKTDITDVGGQVSTLESTVSGIETEITEMKTDITEVEGQVSILEDNVANLVKRSDYCAYQNVWSSDNHVVTYDRLLVDNNVNMPGSTLDIGTGKFTAATSGLYQVDVSMWMRSYSGDYNDVYLRRNGANIAESRMYSWVLTSGGSDEMGGTSLMVHLEEGDDLALYAEVIYQLHYVTFCIKLAK